MMRSNLESGIPGFMIMMAVAHLLAANLVMEVL